MFSLSPLEAFKLTSALSRFGFSAETSIDEKLWQEAYQTYVETATVLSHLPVHDIAFERMMKETLLLQSINTLLCRHLCTEQDRFALRFDRIPLHDKKTLAFLSDLAELTHTTLVCNDKGIFAHYSRNSVWLLLTAQTPLEELNEYLKAEKLWSYTVEDRKALTAIAARPPDKADRDYFNRWTSATA